MSLAKEHVARGADLLATEPCESALVVHLEDSPEYRLGLDGYEYFDLFVVYVNGVNHGHKVLVTFLRFACRLRGDRGAGTGWGSMVGGWEDATNSSPLSDHGQPVTISPTRQPSTCRMRSWREG